MTEQTTDPMIGRLLDGRYQVRSRIARGGMATVYLATDLRLERRVAIKVMHGHLADDSQFKERFIQEARSAARLAHPNVVNVFDQGEDSDMAYLVMEYLPGITLRDLLKEHKTLTAEQTLDILEAVLAGLAAAHRAGIVHRDLKPENVMLADDGRIKIGDFGLARAASANTATGAALLGTIAYLSPELVTRGVADTRSDIYAVGIMMYEMLAGAQPFTGSQPMQIAYQHANESVPPPSAKNPRVPAELDELVLWATAKDPAQRPRDAGAMLEQLGDTQRELATALPPARRGGTGPQPTMAMPALPTALLTATGDQPTQFLGTGPAPVDVSTSTGRLTQVASRRRRRGWWAFALVLVLAAAAGGTGWYFGAGPGGRTTVPTAIVRQDADAAAAALHAAGLEVGKTSKAYSTTVAAGLVIDTDPATGSPVAKGATVDLIVSRGARPITMPKLTGKSLAAAQQAATDAGLVLDGARDTQQFTTKTPKDRVIAVYGLDAAGNPVELGTGAGYFEGGTVFFTVALGPLPTVVGLDQNAAMTALGNVDVTGTVGGEQFDDAPAGTVIDYTPKTGVKPNDTVRLTISKGPDLVDVPNVVGDTINSAVSRLKGADLAVQVDTNLPNIFGIWDQQKVQSISGDGLTDDETQAKRGSTIVVHAHNDDFGGGDED
ncbi:Stk1 family PASTA domain-containing Ser/Thr kinase [Galbitalea sp. SE-J8]|uniref:Stk1 family PASTA domain-containing Ser/Thr kinase n=1 Tax=Galbitalea sp. SE-J8 TaxID=3054952 RepID=UPI00259CAA9D|nr:Stk1 family PASTA domain-containing Ser/Thr kinase [Galbitalea sp. SE-J8]MDM4763072.1 Stk1 family PASTA domain-containing Ser/Thr kinase [Galbitalea sp. SE-J8]